MSERPKLAVGAIIKADVGGRGERRNVRIPIEITDMSGPRPRGLVRGECGREDMPFGTPVSLLLKHDALTRVQFWVAVKSRGATDARRLAELERQGECDDE